MKFINRKDKNGNYVLSDAELVSMITILDKKYDLSSTSYPGYFVWEITRDDERLGYTECILTRYTSDDAPIREIEDSCSMNDFDIFSLRVHDENEENLRRDFRKFMFAKFGAEYLAEFKNYISTQRANEIKEQTEEINSKYDSELEMLP